MLGLVRAAAARYLQLAVPQTALRLGYPLLDDPIRAVSLAAAHSLAPLLGFKLPKAQMQNLTRALAARGERRISSTAQVAVNTASTLSGRDAA